MKGVFSGLGSLMIALLREEGFPAAKWIVASLFLGFVAYGLSIFLYVRAQSTLGAAKTSAYYAVAPFIGTALSFVVLREKLSALYVGLGGDDRGHGPGGNRHLEAPSLPPSHHPYPYHHP